MKTLFLAVFAAVAATAAAHAATLIEPLRARAGMPAEFCTADRVWCVSSKDGTAIVHHRDTGAVGMLALEMDEDKRIESTIWRSIVRVKQQGQGEFVLVGVARTQREAYSGGGGSLTTLSLFELRPDPNVKPLNALDVPLESSFIIRACFSKEDERRRRGACHDEYRYRARLTVAPRSPNGMRLGYKAQAQSFPGPRGRFDDSATEGQLRKADLYWANDRRCTFRRDLVRNATTGALVWNAPPPACPEYVELQ